MSVFSLEVEPFGGCSISEACHEAVRLADRLGITIIFNFNGVRCMACSGDCPKLLVMAWDAELKKPAGKFIKIARGGPQ